MMDGTGFGRISLSQEVTALEVSDLSSTISDHGNLHARHNWGCGNKEILTQRKQFL